MWKAPALLVPALLLFGLSSPRLLAKGLDELSEKSPEGEAAKAALDGTPDPTKKKGDAAEDEGEDEEAKEQKDKPIPPSELSKALAQKLSLATSYGRVWGKQSGGAWKTDGMSDFSVGYVVLPLMDTLKLAATYRYAPTEVSGSKDGHLYRGVWETHYVGGRLTYRVTPEVQVVGSAEIGYLIAHMNPVDDLPPEGGVAKSGAMVAFGGGADYLFFEKGVVSLGPRLYFAAGIATTIQFAVNAGFVF